MACRSAQPRRGQAHQKFTSCNRQLATFARRDISCALRVKRKRAGVKCGGSKRRRLDYFLAVRIPQSAVHDFVSENSKEEEFVAHVSVKDPDEGASGDVTCSMNHDHFRFERIQGDNYKVVTSAVLDREAIKEYALEVVCRDGGRPPQSTQTTIKV